MRRKAKPYQREDLYTAIVIVVEGQKHVGKKFHKIKNHPATIERFKAFAKNSFQGAQYISFYGGITRNFIRREVLI